MRFVWLWVKNLRCLAVYNVGIRLGMMRGGNYGGSLRLSRLLLWLFIVLLRWMMVCGAWESINSVQQNAPGRSTVVNISHHHHFPKQQLQRRKPTSTKKTDTAIVVKSFTSSQEAQRVPHKYMKPVDEPQQKIINFFFSRSKSSHAMTRSNKIWL